MRQISGGAHAPPPGQVRPAVNHRESFAPAMQPEFGFAGGNVCSGWFGRRVRVDQRRSPSGGSRPLHCLSLASFGVLLRKMDLPE